MLIKILVVDDSVSDRLFITNMLSEYCVLTASDGVEAMRVLEEHDGINLLILDLHMPNMNGFQVLEAIKEKERYQKLRTIIMTSSDELENEIKALKLGAIDFSETTTMIYLKQGLICMLRNKYRTGTEQNLSTINYLDMILSRLR